MLGRVFNRRRRLGVTEPPDWASQPTEEREPVQPEPEIPVEEAQRLISPPAGGWAHTNTGLLRIVDGLRNS